MMAGYTDRRCAMSRIHTQSGNGLPRISSAMARTNGGQTPAQLDVA
jgi:hypothetical protein